MIHKKFRNDFLEINFSNLFTDSFPQKSANNSQQVSRIVFLRTFLKNYLTPGISYSLFDLNGFILSFCKFSIFFYFVIQFFIWSTLSLRELFKILTLQMQASTRFKFSHIGEFWKSHCSVVSIFWQKFDYFMFKSFMAALKSTPAQTECASALTKTGVTKSGTQQSANKKCSFFAQNQP